MWWSSPAFIENDFKLCFVGVYRVGLLTQKLIISSNSGNERVKCPTPRLKFDPKGFITVRKPRVECNQTFVKKISSGLGVKPYSEHRFPVLFLVRYCCNHMYEAWGPKNHWYSIRTPNWTYFLVTISFKRQAMFRDEVRQWPMSKGLCDSSETFWIPLRVSFGARFQVSSKKSKWTSWWPKVPWCLIPRSLG